ncbi:MULTISPECIES: alpha/beta fold hydrolase [unclassified Devosia]|uniref:alpha/beta hydrolase n=1 Tax=unclassified Devosia TaxID=196773 RepID=UPI001553FE43|nr:MULTISPECIES: alpha/beta fold hydrolase [unclassified Devosia]
MSTDAPQRRAAWYLPWTLAAGLLFALLALGLAPLLGLNIGGAVPNRAGSVPWPVLLAGVFLCGWLVWWLLMPSWTRVSPLAGTAAGILAATLSYPVVLGLNEMVVSDTPATGGIQWVVWVAGLGLMTTGFAAAMALGLAGGILAWALIAFIRPHDAARNRPSRSVRTLSRNLRRAARVGALIFAVGLTGSFVILSLTPVPVQGLSARPSATAPAQSYEEAFAAFYAVRGAEGELALHKRCSSQLLTHGRKTTIAVVFFHGLTSCPAQGEALARSVFALGYNVYLPRMFGHGEADPDTVSLAALTAEHLVDLANSSTDLAQGLGDNVVVVGLSAGGTIVTWAAQHRSDIRLAVPVSPFLGPYIVPPWANTAATNLLLLLPNMMFWINPLAPVTAPQTDYVFPRPSTHTLAQVMRLGEAVMHDAAREPPAVARISVVLNEADVAVNNQLTDQLVNLWRSRDPDVSTERLEFSNHLPHDLINPQEIFGNTDLIYSLLADMIQEAQE